VCNTHENFVGIKIGIGNKIADTMLPYLESRKEEIESSLGETLTWNPNPDRWDKVIQLLFPTDFNNSEKVDMSINWLIDKTVKFREVFSKIIKLAPEMPNG
jgi:hypothetical protein